MNRSILTVFSAAALLLSVTAASNAQPIGDPPFSPEAYAYEPALGKPGCLSWNWQQYSWYNHCPIYVRPSAIMYPFSSRRALRVKG